VGQCRKVMQVCCGLGCVVAILVTSKWRQRRRSLFAQTRVSIPAGGESNRASKQQQRKRVTKIRRRRRKQLLRKEAGATASIERQAKVC
jgi:hypothetical protein